MRALRGNDLLNRRAVLIANNTLYEMPFGSQDAWLTGGVTARSRRVPQNLELGPYRHP